jgi:uncharacterized protein (UPF0335 family)
MAKRSSEPAPRNVGNFHIDIPDDKTAAARYVYQRVLKLQHERQRDGEHIRDALKAAKEKGANVAALRTAARLKKMSPEKRVKWEQTITDAASFFGYLPLTVADEMPREKDIPHADALAGVVALQQEQKRAGEKIREIFKAAKEAGVDIDSVRVFLRMAKRDQTEIQDWFDGLDMTGSALGIWSGDTEYLQADAD